MQTRCTRSNLELREPRNGLKLDPRNSRWVRSAPLFALIQNLTTRGAVLGLPGRWLLGSWGRSG
eukprot:13768131-Alexandrium_andersonii.AAC.1